MPGNTGRESPELVHSTVILPSRPPPMVKRSNRSLYTPSVETLAKALGLHQLGAHLTLPTEWLLGASTGGLCSCYQAHLGSV